MSRSLRTMWIGCAVLVFCGASPAGADDARQAVIDTMQRWEKAVENKDYRQLEKFYAEDAVYYPSDSLPVVGREAILDVNRRRGATSDVDITQRPDDVRVNGDWAIYSCLARIRLPAADGDGESVRHVRVLLIMQKQEDGRWTILRDIDNATPETL